VLSGDVLSRWLQNRAGTVVAGSVVRLSTSGLLRMSTVVDSRPVQVMLPVAHGGQAAVARAVPHGHDGPSLALRVQAVSSEQEKARQMERLVAMLTVAEAARADPATYPAVLPVLESFVVGVPSTELGSTGPVTEHELWCDTMAWCPRNLADHCHDLGAAARGPRAVVSALLPVMATVRAVHDNLNIVHRDITPANVLVDETGRLLLADWGIAHTVAADRTSTHTQMVGNRGFSLPPEMLLGNTAVGRYTDAWYLGSLLVWMLTGHAPGPMGELPPTPGGPQLVAVAQGLCHRDPAARLDLSLAVAHLARLAGSTGTLPPPASTTSVLTPGPAPTFTHPGQPPYSTGQVASYAGAPVYGTRPGAARAEAEQLRSRLAGFQTGAQTTRYAPSVGSGVQDARPWDEQAPSGTNTKALAVVATGVVLLVVIVVAGLWFALGSRPGTPAAKPSGTSSTTATARPSAPSPTPDPEPDDPEPDYPPFTGLAAAKAAFPLTGNPTCSTADASKHWAVGAKEVYRCTWPGINATLYLSLWPSAAAGAKAWENVDSTALGAGSMIKNSGSWSFTADPDNPRGPSFEISTTPSNPMYTTLCYYDLPYCSTVEFGDAYEYKKADARRDLLTAAQAAALVASWKA